MKVTSNAIEHYLQYFERINNESVYTYLVYIKVSKTLLAVCKMWNDTEKGDPNIFEKFYILIR